MGTSFRDFLDSADRKQETSVQTPIDRWSGNNGDDNLPRLDFAKKMSDPAQAQRSARVLRLSAKTDLSPDFIDQNLDEVEKEAQRYDFDPEKFKVNNPKVASWLGENLHHMNVARGDLKKLSYLERQARFIKEQYEQGSFVNELAALGEKSALQGLTPAEKKRRFDLKVRTQGMLTAEDYGIGKTFADIPGAISNQIPIQGKTYIGGALGAGAGALAGAVTGLVAGAPGGPAGTALGAAAGGMSGAAIGMRVGVGVAAGRMEMGLAYNDYEDIRDENGKPLDKDVALGAALAVGAVNGLLEIAEAEALLKTIPGLRGLTREGVKSALAKPTARAAIARWARGIGQTAATEGITETLQSLITSGGGVLATAASSENPKDRQDIISKWFSEANFKQALAEGIAGAKAGGGTALGTATLSLGVDLHAAKRARQAGQFFEALGDVTKNAELTKQLPDKMREVVDRITKNGPVETVYAPVQTFNEYWEKKEIEPAKVAEEMGIKEQYDEANLNGTDIAIPTSLYAEKLAPTEHNGFFTRELRTSPEAMNVREVEELSSTMGENESKLSFNDMPDEIKKGATDVVEGLTQQLIATGQDEVTARTSSEALYGRLYKSLAKYGVKSERLNEVFSNITVNRVDGAVSVDGDTLLQDLPASKRANVDVTNHMIQHPDNLGGGEYNTPALVSTARENGKVIGAVHGLIDGNNVTIFSSVVSGNQKNKGYGYEMYKRLIDEAHRRGYRVFSDSGHSDDAARVYKKLAERGYNVVPQSNFKSPGFNPQVEVKPQAPLVRQLEDQLRRTETLFQNGDFISNELNIPKLLGGFFSKGEQTIQQKMPVRASVSDVRNIIKDVKAEERYWTGIDKYLDSLGDDAVVEKSDILNYLLSHRVEIVEEGGATLTGESRQDAIDSQFEEDMKTWINRHVRDTFIIGEDNGQWFANPNTSTLAPWEMSRLGQSPNQFPYRVYGTHQAYEFGPYANREEATYEMRNKVEQMLNDAYEVDEDASEFWNDMLRDAEATVDEGGGVEQYESYTLPGGERYRILKLTLPNLDSSLEPSRVEYEIIKAEDDDKQYRLIQKPLDGFNRTSVHMGYFDTYEAAEAHLQSIRVAQVRQRSAQVFSSSHFSEANIVVHIRVKDRTLPDGRKMLFIEEIQSDWHQQGRDKGYKGDVTDEMLSEANSAIGRARNVIDEFNEEQKNKYGYLLGTSAVSSDDQLETERVYSELHKAEEVHNSLLRQQRNGIPNAPFKRTWHELALKRMIRHAAEGGYDIIGWTTGDQQAERYDLSTQVDGIHWSASGDGNVTIITKHNWTDQNRPVMAEYDSDYPSEYKWYVGNLNYHATDYRTEDEARHAYEHVLREGNTSLSRSETVPLDDLNDWVGTSLTKLIKDKIAAGEVTGMIEGDQLKVGGHGMRTFYDQIVPKFLRDFTKKYGGVIEDTKLATSREIQYDAKEKKYFIYDDELDLIIGQYDTREEAAQDLSDEIAPVHSLKLTPELKQAALRDEFALYQRKRADTNTPSFKRWFANSKIVDENGEPLVVVHGTTAKFRAFDVNVVSMSAGEGTIEIGSHFGTESQAKDRTSGDVTGVYDGKTYKLKGYLRIQNPIRVRDRTDHSPTNIIPSLLDLGILSNREVAILDQIRHDAENSVMLEAGVDPLDPNIDDIMDGPDVREVATAGELAVVTSLREMLMDKGYDGVVYLNRHEGIGEPVDNSHFGLRYRLDTDAQFKAQYPNAQDSYIIFDPAQFKNQRNVGTFDIRNPDMYKQGDENAPKGSINFEGGVNISLFENADLSTFIHETGHFYLEVLRALATDNESVKRDHDIIMNWLGAGDGELLSREQHEMFARGFEAYLMEGRSPVPELRAAFSRFRAWLLTIYRSLTNLEVNLTPEVRGVFDRLVASEDEITAAQMAIGPMFQDPAASGLTEEQAAEYEKAVAQQKAAAEEELTKKLLNDVKREQNRQYKLQRDKIKEEVTDEVNQDPAWVALSALQRNQLPDGTPLLANKPIPKLNRAAVIDILGSDFALRGLPKFITQKSGGMHPDEAAAVFGYNSGVELLEALPNNDTAKAHIERLTDERMKKEQGDLYTDGHLPVAAAKAVHNVERSKLLQKELQLLATNRIGAFKGMVRKLTQHVPTIEAVRTEAENIINSKQMRDIKPSLYARAERQSAKAALEAFLAGDVELAFREKEKELHNHELYRAAIAASEREDTVVNYMAKFNRKPIRQKLGRAGADYLEQIDGLRQRFDFRVSVSNKSLDEKSALSDFVNRMADQGLQIDVPAKLLNELNRKHYKELTLQELNDIYNTAKQIEHLSTLKNKLLANKKRRAFNDAKTEIIGAIYENHDITPEPLNLVPNLSDRVKAWTRKGVAAHTKLEFLFEWLDGLKNNGPVWQNLFKPIADAEDMEHRLAHEAAKKMHEIFGKYSLEERAKWYYNRVRVDGFDTAFTKANLLAVALNWGNEGNRQALRDSYGWTDDKIQTLLDHLDARDWGIVQEVWDYLDTYWPAVSALEAELKGLPPDKVVATPIVNKHGTFRGGYYPIIFDSKMSWRTAVLDAKQETRELFGGRWSRAMTRHGHTEERVGSAGKPVRLELSGLTEHVANVIHDLSHRRAIIDVGRLTDDAEVRQAIEQTMGRDMYRQINPWLVNIARDRRSDSTNPLEGLLSRARAGASIVNMGWKMTTGIAQVFGYTGSVKELGVKYGIQGMNETYRQPWKMREVWEFATTRSEFMHSRLTNFDRDARDALKSLGVEGTRGGPLAAVDVYAAEVLHSWFILSGYMDMGVSLPTWIGGYRKAMDGAVNGIEKGDEEAAIGYADKVVRQTQGVGSAKDLALVQQGNESFRLFTMFYSYFSGLFNQFVKVGHEYQTTKNKGQLIASLALLWWLPAALSELSVGRGPDEPDDPMDWLKWLAKVELLYPTQSVILLRDVANGMTKYGYDPSAAFDAYESLSKAGRAVTARLTGDKENFTRSDLKNAVQTVGYFAHLPTKQVWLSAEYLHDWMTGDEQPASFGEGLIHTLVTGKPRK